MTDLSGIAIVGLSARVPGAANAAAFWTNLIGGVESVSFFTREELADAGVPARVLAHPGYVGASAVLRGIDRFDATFFGLTPREAALLDPQGRLFMECAWEALEHAGYTADHFEGLIGVFGGIGASRYFMRNVMPSTERIDGAGAYQAMIANDKDFIPPWVSYKLNLKGPSVAIQTACSTSLVAVHMACQSLLTYQCDMALAGGASLALDEVAGYVFQEGGILSPDGHCRPFDADAKGTVHGSGAGMVALRRLEDAVASGDPIIAVIKGSAINNDGAVKVGFTAPAVDGQIDVISMAQAVAGIDADTISFVEGHGTGTPLGDPVEVSALTRVFRRQTVRREFCALGSVKGNVGHLDTAAGVTGLIKAALAVEHGKIPPTVHFKSANPQMELASTPFFVNAETVAWPADSHPRRAGVSSFGIGGTNAHVVLEEAPPARVSSAPRPWQILALSAMTPAALEAQTDALADAIDAAEHASLADTAYTLLVGRKSFAERRIVICTDINDAIDSLDARAPSRMFTGRAPATERPVTFMFPGQGSQHIDMARELYDDEPVFRAEFDQCANIVRSLAGLDLRAVLLPKADEHARAIEQLGKTDVCQLALFTVELALARTLMALGVTPQSFIGHSVGEYVAACLAGVFTVEDALSAVAARGRLMAEMPRGEMLAVSAPEADVKTWIDPAQLSIAVVNSPKACVVAGPAEAVSALSAALDERGVLHRRLDVSHAFHSHMMDAALPKFRDAMRAVTLSAPHTPFISNVTGTWIRSEEATDPEYWVRQMRRTVYFADGLGELLKEPQRVAVEVGPGRTLQALALQQRARTSQQEIIAVLPDARDSRATAETVTTAIGRLWLAGVDVNWSRYYERETRNRVHLPTYPFQRERHWIEPPAKTVTAEDTERQPFAKWFYTPRWKQSPLVPKSDAVSDPLSWLVASDAVESDHVAEALAAALLKQGHRVVKRTSDQRDALRETDAALDRVVCFAASFASTLNLIQSLAATPGHPLHVTIVQSGVRSVTGDETIEPERAAVLGICAVVPQEMPGLLCRHVDVAWPQHETEQARLVNQLMSECAERPDGEAIAYRGRLRWTLTHSRIEALPTRASRFKAKGVYWITGGTGGIGLSLAEHIANACQARLVLTSRSASAVSEAVRDRIRQLEAQGSEVLLIQADAANVDEMRKAADQIEARFGQVDGVIHAAGIAAGRLTALETATGAEVVIAPKLRGALNLEAALERFTPDFVVYCSSLAALLGGVGQAAYAGANAALDAMAEAQTARQSRLTISVNWDRWRDVGMAATLADADAIGSVDGARALETILGLALPRVAVSTFDLAARTRAFTEQQAPVEARTFHARPALSNDYVRPSNDAETALAALWQDVLGLGQIGIDDNFFELGGDSLTALRLIAVLTERTNVAVPVTTLYGAPTIRKFLADVPGATALGQSNGTKISNTGARR